MYIYFEEIWERKVAFLLTFFLVFTMTYIALVALDWLPEEPAAEESVEVEAETTVESGVSAEENTAQAKAVVEDISTIISDEIILPTSISIKKLDKVVPVLNPSSRNIADLDNALLNGVVRHPDSATLSQNGTVFILGHSSYLPKVLNKNFQAFNGIQKLEWGDIIEVSSENYVFEYRVEKVYRAQAKDVTVPIAGDEKTLTLATCNSFGSVDDRYIVEAKQISVKAL